MPSFDECWPVLIPTRDIGPHAAFSAVDGQIRFAVIASAAMKLIETYSLHRAGNVTRRLAQLPGASELPLLTLTVERGTDLKQAAEELRRLADVFDRQS